MGVARVKLNTVSVKLRYKRIIRKVALKRLKKKYCALN